MKFLVDEKLAASPLIVDCAAGLRRNPCTRCSASGKARSRNSSLRVADDRTIITRDRDFERFEREGRTPRVLLIEVGNISTPRLLAWIEKRWLAAMDAFARSVHTVKID